MVNLDRGRLVFGWRGVVTAGKNRPLNSQLGSRIDCRYRSQCQPGGAGRAGVADAKPANQCSKIRSMYLAELVVGTVLLLCGRSCVARRIGSVCADGWAAVTVLLKPQTGRTTLSA